MKDVSTRLQRGWLAFREKGGTGAVGAQGATTARPCKELRGRRGTRRALDEGGMSVVLGIIVRTGSRGGADSPCQPHSQVSFVACVRNQTRTTTNQSYLVEDGTGAFLPCLYEGVEPL